MVVPWPPMGSPANELPALADIPAALRAAMRPSTPLAAVPLGLVPGEGGFGVWAAWQAATTAEIARSSAAIRIGAADANCRRLVPPSLLRSASTRRPHGFGGPSTGWRVSAR